MRQGDSDRLEATRIGLEKSLTLVGIIANPASGKDIRRLVSHATVVNNHEKVSIVRRLLLSLGAAGVEQVEIMPDLFGIGSRALDGLRDHSEILAATSIIDMVVEGNAEDSLVAARHLRDKGAGCIAVLGGDGTCRVVSKGCGEVPLLAISTGTNNVIPTFVEGTVAGSAAAYVARHPEVALEQVAHRHKRLAVHVNGQETDHALVEVAAVSASFVGARAVWEAGSLRQIWVTRAQPTTIGLSSVIGVLQPVDPMQPEGATATIEPGARQLMAPLAPGTIVPVSVGEVTNITPGRRYPIGSERPVVLALDGEREIALTSEDRAEISLELDGPWLVDLSRTLRMAVAAGAFWA
jgi:predicted polyphosphate/ATP-dependent NAD kinase